MKIYIDGNYFSREDARISVYDHGLLYGDGIFEGIRIYHGEIFRLEEHIYRLFQSAAAIKLEIPLSFEELIAAVVETADLNEKEDGYIRLVVTRGVGDLGLNPRLCLRPSIIIIVDDIQLYPEEFYRDGISIITSSIRRIPPDSLDPRIKSLNYLNNILAKTEALQAGVPEAIMLNRQGHVAECTADNIFIVRDGEILTPDPIEGALDGITRQVVMECALVNELLFYETPLSQYDLYTADECFLTGTGAELIPVTEIDGRMIGDGKPGQVFAELRETFIAEILPTDNI